MSDHKERTEITLDLTQRERDMVLTAIRSRARNRETYGQPARANDLREIAQLIKLQAANKIE